VDLRKYGTFRIWDFVWFADLKPPQVRKRILILLTNIAYTALIQMCKNLQNIHATHNYGRKSLHRHNMCFMRQIYKLHYVQLIQLSRGASPSSSYCWVSEPGKSVCSLSYHPDCSYQPKPHTFFKNKHQTKMGNFGCLYLCGQTTYQKGVKLKVAHFFSLSHFLSGYAWPFLPLCKL
jgi:hypothetical protein